jgi:hypothetical protein
MSLTPPIPIAGQVGPSGRLPYVQQMNFGQMIGQCVAWNPNLDPSQAAVNINSAVRKLYDRRLWYGLMVKGQIVTPGFYSVGQVNLTLGSASVVGIGTSFNASMVGQALRVGYTNPIYNIIAVPNATTLILELPWGAPSFGPTGYYITQYYYSIPNVKYIYSAKNLQLQYRLWTNVAQNFLENVDPSRLRVMYPWVIATMPPDPNGNYQVELWPASLNQQAIPYLAYVQPPNLVNDSDSLPAYIRCDVVVAHATADALRYRTKDNPYYSEAVALQIASEKMKEFEMEARMMEAADENAFRQDVQNSWEQFPYLDAMTGQRLGGSMIAAMSPVGIGDGDW